MRNYEYEPIKKLKENNKKKMFFVFLTIFMFLGISFATLYFVYRFNDERENTIVSGLVDIDFQEKGASINLQNIVPMTDEAGKKNSPYIFTVENISKIPINLKIGIKIGENSIDLSAIRYALYINNEEVKVDNLANLDSENNLYIKEQFASGAMIEAKLVFWIDYYYEKPGGSFSGTIIVEGEQYDVIYEETGAETIKKTLVPYSKSSQENFTGGLVAVNTDGGLYNETESSQKVREYRYSGPEVNNYIYFNCQDKVEQNRDNCEVWRIIGVFKDEKGEHIKIVRNEVLSIIKKWDSSNNDWVNADLKEYLNTEYYETLTINAKKMIESTKYYLGNFKSGNDGDTAISSYIHERGNAECSESCNGGDIWSGNQATWDGNIALMYPSDYGYTAGYNWNTILSSSISSTSWLNSVNHSSNEWFLSPSYSNSDSVAYWLTTDNSGSSRVYSGRNVRPTLYLKSEVKIDGGTGTQDSPYTLTMK